MPSVLSPQEYNDVYRILSSHNDNNDDIIASIERSALPKLKEHQSFLDIGPGTGYITKAIRHHFKTGSVIEPSPEFCNIFKEQGYQAQASSFQDATIEQQYDYILCSHVLYNVDIAAWPAFLDKMISSIRAGGIGTIVLSAARGSHHEMCRTLNASHKNTAPIIAYLNTHKIPYSVDESVCHFSVNSFDEMYTLCRFTLLEDCYTPEKYWQLNADEKQRLDDRIRDYAHQQLQRDGSYRLSADVDYIHIHH